MDPDNPALNADGSLKNADEIEWHHSPTQPNRILLPIKPSARPPSASVSKPTYRKERRHYLMQIDARRMAEKKRWIDDSVVEVQKLKFSAGTA